MRLSSMPLQQSICVLLVSSLAKKYQKANKTAEIQLDISGETRQVFSGIKSAYKPEGARRQAGSNGDKP
ncbi:hypothetical protein O9992_03025 [Vibrio lentus]|nr:hypothetical protein [Vibrio lentus]